MVAQFWHRDAEGNRAMLAVPLAVGAQASPTGGARAGVRQAAAPSCCERPTAQRRRPLTTLFHVADYYSVETASLP